MTEEKFLEGVSSETHDNFEVLMAFGDMIAASLPQSLPIGGIAVIAIKIFKAYDLTPDEVQTIAKAYQECSEKMKEPQGAEA